MKILVLLGGDSPEREVSLRSGRSVSDALRVNGHEVTEFDPQQGYSGLDGYIGKVDVVLPILHGVNGEDGEPQKELERRGFKFLGSDSKVSKLCFDKAAFKKEIIELGFKTPKSEIVDKEGYQESDLSKGYHVLKPIHGGSTIDSFIVNQPDEKVDLSVFDRHPQMLLEELIVGHEITIPVLAGEALPVIEIIPPEGEDFDYENKYNGETQELCPPVNVSEELQKKAQAVAKQLHQKTGVRHLSRTDIMIDEDSELYVLEINTMPGMTTQSLYPKSARVAGISMEELVDMFARMAANS